MIRMKMKGARVMKILMMMRGIHSRNLAKVQLLVPLLDPRDPVE